MWDSIEKEESHWKKTLKWLEIYLSKPLISGFLKGTAHLFTITVL